MKLLVDIFATLLIIYFAFVVAFGFALSLIIPVTLLAHLLFGVPLR